MEHPDQNIPTLLSIRRFAVEGSHERESANEVHRKLGGDISRRIETARAEARSTYRTERHLVKHMLIRNRPLVPTLRINNGLAQLHEPVIAPSALKTASAPAPKKIVHRQIAQHPALAPTQKSLYSPLHHSSSASIASLRTDAITRHLSTGSQSQLPTMSYGKGLTEFSARQIAPKHTLDYRCYLEKDGTPVSPFHDIPLYANDQQTILNMVVEIPRWTNAKLEAS